MEDDIQRIVDARLVWNKYCSEDQEDVSQNDEGVEHIRVPV